MKIVEEKIWTRILPDSPPDIPESWVRHGGKWILFDRKGPIVDLAERLGPHIDSGEIRGAKYWNRDPSALCVYSLDQDKETTLQILKDLGAKSTRVWEYDYAWDKNLKHPLDFAYSLGSKLRTIVRSYGCLGTLQLAAELFAPRERKSP